MTAADIIDIHQPSPAGGSQREAGTPYRSPAAHLAPYGIRGVTSIEIKPPVHDQPHSEINRKRVVVSVAAVSMHLAARAEAN